MYFRNHRFLKLNFILLIDFTKDPKLELGMDILEDFSKNNDCPKIYNFGSKHLEKIRGFQFNISEVFSWGSVEKQMFSMHFPNY